MPNYTRSYSRKQWTQKTEGVFKNVIDAIKQGAAIPKGFLIPSHPVEEGFSIYIDPASYEVPYGIAVTKAFEVCVQSNQNWTGTVSISQSNNLCAGSNVSLDEDSLVVSAQTPKNCALLRAGIPATCPPGVYTITVTGQSGSIKRVAYAEIKVGSPPDEEEPESCESDSDCKKFGDDFYCVNGECVKACGTSIYNCNSDACPAGSKCVWDDGAGKCVCKPQDILVECSSIYIPTGQGKMGYGAITIKSLNGFAGSGSVMLYDVNQPEQAPATCLAHWLRYGSQIGNIIPFTLNPDGSVSIGVEISSSCDVDTTHYYAVDVLIGGKNITCTFAVEVKSSGIWYFDSIIQGELFLCTSNVKCTSATCRWYGCVCNDDCSLCTGQPWKVKVISLGFIGTVDFTVASSKCCNFGTSGGAAAWCVGGTPGKCDKTCKITFDATHQEGYVYAHGDLPCESYDPARCQGGSCPSHMVILTYIGVGGGLTQTIVVNTILYCKRVG